MDDTDTKTRGEAPATMDELVLRELGLWSRLTHTFEEDPAIAEDRLVAVQRRQEASADAHARYPDDIVAPRPTLTNIAQLVAEYDTDDPDRTATQLVLTHVLGAHIAMAVLDETEEERERRMLIIIEAISTQMLSPRARRDLPQRWRDHARNASLFH